MNLLDFLHMKSMMDCKSENHVALNVYMRRKMARKTSQTSTLYFFIVVYLFLYIQDKWAKNGEKVQHILQWILSLQVKYLLVAADHKLLEISNRGEMNFQGKLNYVLDRSPAFLTSDDFVRSNEIIRTKRQIYVVIGHFVLMISSERKKSR